MTAPKGNHRTRGGKSCRLAVIADIHGDAPTLRAALERIREYGCGQTVCLGDLADYGAFPEETISIIREARIPCIRGNHDRWVVQTGKDIDGRPLTYRAVSYLESLPRLWIATIAGVQVGAWHARSGSDMDSIYVDVERTDLATMLDQMNVDVLMVGHSHLPMCLTLGDGRMVANPGALLKDPEVPLIEGVRILDPVSGEWKPTPKPCGGTFGVLELPERKFTVYRATDGCEVEIERRRVGFFKRQGPGK